MNKLLKIFFISFIAYASISCFCRGPKLTQALVKDSDLIFEGKCTKVDTIPGADDDLLLTFKTKKVFKGESKKYFTVTSSNGSCGLTSYKWKHRVLGKTYLLYLTKEENQYVYYYCSNRITYEKLHKDDMNYEESRNVTNANHIYSLEYKQELKSLDSLLTLK